MKMMGRFQNLGGVRMRGLSGLLRWQFSQKPEPWPEWIEEPAGPAPPSRVHSLRVTFVNHSTVLIQMDGLNILTDPVWSERASPVAWAGPRRHRAPGIRFEDLPPIDVVLVSHNHYDHMDMPTLQRLAREHAPRMIVPLGNAAYLGGAGELGWWQQTELPGIRLTCVPAQHFSGRGLRDRNDALWCGYVLEGAAGSVYFAGDTGFGPHFEQIRDRFPRIRVALLPVGAYRPRWFMAPAHLSPYEAVHTAKFMRAESAMAIHFGTFALGDDGPDEAAEEVRRELETLGEAAPRFRVPAFGEGRDCQAAFQTAKWQRSPAGR